MLSSKMSQPVKTRSSSPASGTNSLILGERPSVRLPETDRAHLGERADRLGDSLAHGFDARNKGGGDRAHARNHYAELCLWRARWCRRLSWAGSVCCHRFGRPVSFRGWPARREPERSRGARAQVRLLVQKVCANCLHMAGGRPRSYQDKAGTQDKNFGFSFFLIQGLTCPGGGVRWLVPPPHLTELTIVYFYRRGNTQWHMVECGEISPETAQGTAAGGRERKRAERPSLSFRLRSYGFRIFQV